MATRSSILNVAGQAQGVIQYLRSLDAELIWTPGRNSKSGIDWSKNGLTTYAQNTGDLTLSTAPYPPIIGGAPVCEFGGASGNIAFGNLGSSITNHTLVFVAKKPSTASGTMTLFGTQAGSPVYYLYWGYATKHRIRLYADGAQRVYWVASDTADDEWHTLILTDNGTGTRIYWDGISVLYNASSAGLPSNANRYQLGAGGDTNHWQGSVALFSLLDFAVDADQAEAIHYLTVAGA